MIARGRPVPRQVASSTPLAVPPPAVRPVTAAGDRGGVGVGAFLLAVVTAGALAHVAVRLKGLEVAYELGRERRITADLEEQRRGLQIEIGMLKDPGRVVLIARDKLKMGPPAADAIRALGPGSILTPILTPIPSPIPSPILTAGVPAGHVVAAAPVGPTAKAKANTTARAATATAAAAKATITARAAPTALTARTARSQAAPLGTTR